MAAITRKFAICEPDFSNLPYPQMAEVAHKIEQILCTLQQGLWTELTPEQSDLFPKLDGESITAICLTSKVEKFFEIQCHSLSKSYILRLYRYSLVATGQAAREYMQNVEPNGIPQQPIYPHYIYPLPEEEESIPTPSDSLNLSQ